MLAQTSKRAAAFFSIRNSSRDLFKTKFGTLAGPAALNLGRSQAALLVNTYHTGQAVPRAAVGLLSSAMAISRTRLYSCACRETQGNTSNAPGWAGPGPPTYPAGHDRPLPSGRA